MKFINVMQSGEVFADGIHDDTKALQSCIDKVKDGGTVYFPDGTYLLSAALIFYSNQHLKFSDKATVLRSAEKEPLTRYLLASYSEPGQGGYSGTHNVIISGGIFDGNADITEKITIINTVHCNNIVIENCRFVHCAHWHCIELNGTQNATVRNCIFDGPSYTFINERLYNEQIQLDLSRHGYYGPVYNCDGTLIDFMSDDTVCRNITIKDNIFKCNGFPGIGHHSDCAHCNIDITGNIFDGASGIYGKSRGYIFFRPSVYGLSVVNNVFIAPEETDSPSYGIILENADPSALITEGNLFTGKIDREIIQGTDY